MKKAFRPCMPLDEDMGTTRVRIETSQMKELGINPGDVVKVTGVRGTGAVCLPVNNGYRHPGDSEITYLPWSAVLPQARLSDIVTLNINNMMGALQVDIEKVQSSKAQKVLFSSVNPDINLNNLDRSKLLGTVVCKGDRMKLRDCRQIIVTDVHPADFSIIDEATEIEFASRSVPPNLQLSVPGLDNLRTVIPVVKRVQTEMAGITIPSIEIYDGGARFYLYVRGDYASYDDFQFGHLSLGVRVHDNIGNSYNVLVGGGGGSSGGGRFNYDYSCMFAPAVDANASELIITVKEILFQAPFMPPPSISGRAEMRPIPHGMKFPAMLVLAGPWEFKVVVK
jgi:hypothetical protein